MKKMIVTGSCGLIGSEVCMYFSSQGWRIYGVDNNQRRVFFGESGDTSWMLNHLQEELPGYKHYALDIRDRETVKKLILEVQPDAIVHTAAQPSHDLAARLPYDDFDVNATGTLNMVEGLRQHSVEVPFVHLSTNKVYGDAPNEIKMKESETRYMYDDPAFENGIAESLRIDQTKHSLFGASKVAADIVVQEYGRYFNMPTVCLRGGCLTGSNYSSVELHGFLNYLIKCNFEERVYTIFGYKGKQVRDNIHSHDVVRFIDQYLHHPRPAEVYNIGGGLENTCSVLEAFKRIENLSGKAMQYTYLEENRIGDHICYYSDLRKMKSHYPSWSITRSLDAIFEEIYESWEWKRGKEA